MRVRRQARGAWSRPRAGLLAAGLLAMAGCATNPPALDGMPGAPPAPQTPWTAPASVAAAPPPAVVVEPAAEDLLRDLTLAEVVDISLRNSPDTRAAWLDALAAASAYGAARGDLYPRLQALGSAVRAGEDPGAWTGSAGLQAELSYLLLDFGGRAGDIEEARQALLAANWAHGTAVQDKILAVETAFFAYAGAKALLEADKVSLAEADSSLAAAQARREVGLATVADVLQARTARSEAALALLAVEGQVRTTRGALAVAMGYPADVSYDIEIAVPEVPASMVPAAVEDLVQRALAARPDLLAAWARARESAAAARSKRAARLPRLSLGALAGRTWIDGRTDPLDRSSAAVYLDIPLFSGFSLGYDAREAQARADADLERARGYGQAVIYDVFAAHSDLSTATERVAATADLLAAATESQAVAAGRYREGVGSILDLLSAQRALAGARALESNARLAWFTALARLAHSAGVLGAPGQDALLPGISLPEVQP